MNQSVASRASWAAAHVIPPRDAVNNPSAQKIVIVGGGFSGTLVAINLLRQVGSGPLRILLIESSRPGRGIAYAERPYTFLLNVAAGRMSATSANIDEFVDFVRRRWPAATAEDFLPRALYGDYVEALLASAEMSGLPHRRLERIPSRAVAIQRAVTVDRARYANEPGLEVHLEDGRVLLADSVVLACGNPAPATLPALQPLEQDPRYVGNPWSDRASFHRNERVLVLGTGLTMADIVLAGMQAAGGCATVHAVSRHGLIPSSQAAFRPVVAHPGLQELMKAAVSTRRLLRSVRGLAQTIQRRGGDWREAMTLVRGLAPTLWQALPLLERQRFLRHLQTYWDIHRHRLPEKTAAELRDLQQAGKLEVCAGRLLGVDSRGDGLAVCWQGRGEDTPRTLTVDRIINCTGPHYDARRSRDPLLGSLLAQGLATADSLGLGLQTDEFGGLLDSQGRVSKALYYVGPMLRASAWEITAATELRDRAELLARRLATLAARRRTSVSRATL